MAEKTDKGLKGLNIFERAKNKTHHHETHGTSNDIDDDTPIDKVKGPNVFERAKEEIEAIVEAIHPKKEQDHSSKKEKEGGCFGSIGRKLEEVCSPTSEKKFKD